MGTMASVTKAKLGEQAADLRMGPLLGGAILYLFDVREGCEAHLSLSRYFREPPLVSPSLGAFLLVGEIACDEYPRVAAAHLVGE